MMDHLHIQDRASGEPHPGRKCRWIKRIALGLLAALVALVAFGMIYQAIGAAADARRFPPPGELVSVGDYRLHIYCTGEGSPTVVLDTLHGGTSGYWSWVQPELAQITRVCSYDRAGRGWSDHGAKPRDLWGTAEDLHTLLQNAGEEGPYVLVGHSIAGLYVRAFAALYPQETAGMVLVDSVHPEKYIRYPIYRDMDKDWKRLSSVFPALARIGLFRLYFSGGGEIDFQDLPPRQHDELAAFWSTPEYFQNVRAEPGEETHTQGLDLPDLGDLPLGVVSAGINLPEWMALQAELPKLSTNSLRMTIDGASHASLVFNPDHAQQTSAMIAKVVEAVRLGTTLAGQ
jgi:pimeloyl-ACP methyl ester carboxylesterase